MHIHENLATPIIDIMVRLQPINEKSNNHAISVSQNDKTGLEVGMYLMVIRLSSGASSSPLEKSVSNGRNV